RYYGRRTGSDVPAVRAGPALARQLAFERRLPLREFLRVVELFDAFHAVRARDHEGVAVRDEADLAAHVSAALLEPPEHVTPPSRASRGGSCNRTAARNRAEN